MIALLCLLFFTVPSFSLRLFEENTSYIRLCAWGLDMCYPLFKCSLISTGLFLLVFFPPFFGPESEDPSLVLQILLQPQAVINYRHVSSAQSPPSLPPLCDKGHIIILVSNKISVCNLGVGGISRPASYLAEPIRHLCGQNSQKIRAWSESAGDFCCWTEREGRVGDLLETKWRLKAGLEP